MLIEVMDDGPYLVFQCQTKKEIQSDQHGNAQRKSLPTYTIHCLNELKDDLHPIIKQLMPEAEQKLLLNTLIKI